MGRVAFAGGDETGAEVGEVGAQHLGGENLMPVVQAAGQQQGLVEELADLGDQRERAPGPGMATGSRSDGDQPIDPGLGGFFRMAASGHVMEYQAAVAVYGIHHFLDRPQAGDDDRYLVLDADLQIGLQSGVAVVHDQVHGIGRRILQVGQARFDLLQPGLEPTAFTLVERRKAADHAVATAGQDQFWIGDQEHRCCHDGQAQALFEQSGQRHRYTPGKAAR
ncbi:hypothetical protein P308_29695 [Pseudomonas piscis]|nr:hypothetical protein P308_29695 [Pseudomonas piscis]